MTLDKKKLFKNLFAVSVLALLCYLVNPKELWGALSNLTLEAVLYLAVISVVLILISAVKWKMFLHVFSDDISIVRLFNLYLMGYFVNLIIPSYLGGDAVRSWHIGKKVGQHEALAATVLERYTGIVAMAVLAFIFMWFSDLTTPQIKLAVTGLLIALAAGTVVALSDWIIGIISRTPFIKKFSGHLKKVQDGFDLARRDRFLLVKTFALSLLFHSVTVVNTVAAAYAVGWYDPPVWDLFVVLPLILLIGALPVAPSGLGIQEGAFYFFLHGIGATPAQALGIGIVLRAKSYVLAAIGGLVWLKYRNPESTGAR